MANKVTVIMGSERDLDFSKRIQEVLDALNVTNEFRVGSAHKTPEKVLKILRENEEGTSVFITVAGRSNALSAFVDANTVKPVIACPPYSEKFGGADVYSSLRVPSGIGSLITIEPEGAAIAAAKILALSNQKLSHRIKEYQLAKRTQIERADESIRKRG